MMNRFVVLLTLIIMISVGMVGMISDEAQGAHAVPPPETKFHGTVTDAKTGEPIEDALIYCQSRGLVSSLTYHTETDEEGYYEIYPKTWGEHYFVVTHEKFESTSKYSEIKNHEQKVVDFELEPLDFNVKIYGIVHDSETGEPIGEAYVHIQSRDDFTRYDIRADGEGHFEQDVLPGNYTISANQVNYESYSSDEFRVYEGEKKRIEIPLSMIKSGIRGIVTDEGGNPLEGVEISLEKIYLKNPRYIRRYSRSYFAKGTTDAEGRYDIRIREGEYALKAREEPYMPYHKNVRIDENEIVENDIEMVNTPASSFIWRVVTYIWNILGIYI